MWSYVVCATPRSGSTLLCELLKDTGVAGRPEEYFEARSDTGVPPHPGDYLDNLPRTGAGIRDDTTPPRAPEHSSLLGLASYRDHLDRTFELGTTPNGVFGAKLMWRNLADLRQLAGRAPRVRELRPVRAPRAPVPQSPVRLGDADATRCARPSACGAPCRPAAGASSTPARAPNRPSCTIASRASIISYARCKPRTMAGRSSSTGIGSRRWRVTYEEQLEPDPEGAVRAVLDHIGVQPPAGWRPRAKLKRQADALSEEWVAAYHRDAAQQSGRSGSVPLAGR